VCMAEQLRLMSMGPSRFRLDEATRRRGLKGVAQVRAVLAGLETPRADAPPDSRDRQAGEDATAA